MRSDTMTSSPDDIAPRSPRGPRKRSLSVQGRSTSIFISDEMWQEFQEIAAQKNVTANRLASEIRSKTKGSLGGAIRMYILNHRVGGIRP